jgi:hypothetical protein
MKLVPRGKMQVEPRLWLSLEAPHFARYDFLAM